MLVPRTFADAAGAAIFRHRMVHDVAIDFPAISGSAVRVARHLTYVAIGHVLVQGQQLFLWLHHLQFRLDPFVSLPVDNHVFRSSQLVQSDRFDIDELQQSLHSRVQPLLTVHILFGKRRRFCSFVCKQKTERLAILFPPSGAVKRLERVPIFCILRPPGSVEHHLGIDDVVP